MNRSSCDLRTDLDRSEIDLILSDLGMNEPEDKLGCARFFKNEKCAN